MTAAALSRRCAVAVMAKAPRVGAAKTRLIPPLTAAEAAGLSAAFIRDAVGNIADAGRHAPIDGFVAYSPPGAAAEFDRLLAEGTRLLASPRSGLGASLYDAVSDLLAMGYGSACLINSDSPTLPTAMLVRAATALAAPGDRVVLGPAEDGGYYLIGLKKPHASLFEEIAWSTVTVLADTIGRARDLGLDPVLLPAWYDVDDVGSLRRLAAEALDAGDAADGTMARYPAPCTAAFLNRLRERHPRLLAGVLDPEVRASR